MKTTQITFILFIFISLFTYSSCTKDDDSAIIDDDLTGNGTMTAKIDGQKFESKLTSALIADSLGNSISWLLIYAYDSQNSLEVSELFALGITSELGQMQEGSYTTTNDDCELFEGDTVCAGISYTIINTPEDETDDKHYNTDYDNSNAQLTITDIDYRSGGFIRGTFSGTLVNDNDDGDSVNVTDGEFDIKIQ